MFCDLRRLRGRPVGEGHSEEGVREKRPLSCSALHLKEHKNVGVSWMRLPMHLLIIPRVTQGWDTCFENMLGVSSWL